MEFKHDAEELAVMQSLPLKTKIQMSINRIIGWEQYYNGNVYVSFSGGKDSTVLLHLVRSIYPDIEGGLGLKAVLDYIGVKYD